jgi:hypothetical protein
VLREEFEGISNYGPCVLIRNRAWRMQAVDSLNASTVVPDSCWHVIGRDWVRLIQDCRPIISTFIERVNGQQAQTLISWIGRSLLGARAVYQDRHGLQVFRGYIVEDGQALR